MKALQASTSYSVGFGISPAAPLLRPSRHRHVILAQVEPSEKSVEIMRKFSEQYARRSSTYFCVDKGVTSVVIKGLAEHKDTLGAPLCPCRHYDDKPAEVQQGFWNCPCVPMRERKECHCMLFLTPDNDFAGQEQYKKACHLKFILAQHNQRCDVACPFKVVPVALDTRNNSSRKVSGNFLNSSFCCAGHYVGRDKRDDSKYVML